MRGGTIDQIASDQLIFIVSRELIGLNKLKSPQTREKTDHVN